MKTKGIISIFIISVLIFVLVLVSMQLGSINVTIIDVFKGLFVEYDSRVAIIYNLRFPRIIVSLVAGGALAVSGLLFQSTLKNPLADPGIIGISGGALFASMLVTTIFPMTYFYGPIFAIIGGVVAYIMIYLLAWKGTLDPVRIILVGVAISAIFTSLVSVLGSVGNQTGVSLSISGLTQLQWTDVKMISVYSVVSLIIAMCVAPLCNLMSLEDKTVRGLGVNVDLIRLFVSFIAVILCSVTTAVVGVISFLALVSPHIARKIVGHDHKILLPFTMLLGAFMLLLADTIGRTVFSPTEISASVIMSIIGGPFFIFLLRKEVANGKN